MNGKYLEGRIEQIETSIKSLITDVKTIKSKPPYILGEKLNDVEWVSAEQARLKGEIAALEAYRERLQDTFSRFCFPS